tara:strand:+ start:2316 stop:2882 length:567 start_codon:yes stop_codon:yes gene_type:complete
LEIRSPTTKDGAQIWQLVRETGVLDLNSAYLYLLLCRDFCDTCLVAVQEGRAVGFVSSYRLPCDPSVLFVWQVGVASNAKRQGVGLRLLRELIERNARSLTAIEATVSPSNVASRRLFESLARVLGVSVVDVPNGGFNADDFPPGDHETEPRIRISPLGARFSFSDAAHQEPRHAFGSARTTQKLTKD